MNKKAWAVTAIGLAFSMQTSTAHAGGWHGYHGHGNCGGYAGYGNYYYGHSSSDAAIIAATLFGTAAVVNAFTAPQYLPAARGLLPTTACGLLCTTAGRLLCTATRGLLSGAGGLLPTASRLQSSSVLLPASLTAHAPWARRFASLRPATACAVNQRFS